MEAVQSMAATADIPVVMADNAIWLLCAKSGLYLTNPELAELVREHENPTERAEAVGALIRSWANMQDGGEQRETINHLVEGMNQERHSVRKLFPAEFKGRGW